MRENPREMYVKVDRLSLHEVVERGGENRLGHMSYVVRFEMLYFDLYA